MREDQNEKEKSRNPFFRYVKHPLEIEGPTDDEVSEALWGHKDGPLGPGREPPRWPDQGGQHGR